MEPILFVSQSSTLESLKNFQADVLINKDGTIDVKETILYDFGTNQKHGISRNIGIIKTNENGKKFLLDVSIESVTNELGVPYTYTSSKETSTSDIKIGNANELVTGIKTYVIKYKVSGAITYFSDHDELYWNMSGNNWQYPIQKFLGTVTLPPEVQTSQLNATCIDGPLGATNLNCTTNIIGTVVTLTENNALPPGDGVTVVVSFPKNVVSVLEPVSINTEGTFNVTNPIYYIFYFIGALLLIFWVIVLPIIILISWAKERKELKQKAKIVAAWFDPPKLDDGQKFSPAETGLIYDKSISIKEVTATLIDLAMRGYMKIKNDGSNAYSFERLKSYDNNSALRPFEKTLLDGLFSEAPISSNVLSVVTVKSLGQTVAFTNKVRTFNKQVEDSLMDASMFIKRPSQVSTLYIILTIFGFMTLNFPLGFVAFIFGRKSAKRTDKGIEKYSEAASLRNFLVSQDEQLDFQAKNQMFFEKLLPYASAFGVEDVWVKRFEGIEFKQTDWYDGNFSNAAAYIAFSRTFSDSVKSSSGFSSNTSSSGFHSGFSGGSSGGGGGGGGGGSW